MRQVELTRRFRYTLLLVWFPISFLSAVLIFGSGLFLYRDILPHKASCIEDVGGCYHSFRSDKFDITECLRFYDSEFTSKQYCIPSSYKVLVIVVDALRYDFAKYDENVPENKSLPYINKLTVIRDTLQSKPNNSRLYKFIADPPTTTRQRILGLMTGSLPTFVDIGLSFTESGVDEDNIIDSVLGANKTAVFLGDDTWIKLYPRRFLRSYPFDSFNVWDLDTVDTGVKTSLSSELRFNDWDFLIAHFLGVDHCGHRYGPFHKEMKRKLTEINDVIGDVIRAIDKRNDVVLFVIGDHGMTSTGDHGGESENEVTSALFAYSPMEAFSEWMETRTVRQVDIVPTISTILGVSIPFSNTGSVILDCIPVSLVDSPSRMAFVLWRNMLQLTNYIREYSFNSVQFNTDDLESVFSNYTDLKHTISSLSGGKNANEFVRQYTTFMKSVLEMCLEVWVRFNDGFIALGLVFALVVIIFSLVFILSAKHNNFGKFFSTYTVLSCSVFPIACLVILSIMKLYGLGLSADQVLYLSFGMSAVAHIAYIVYKTRFNVKTALYKAVVKVPSALECLILIFYFFSLLGLFSNSFIMEERTMMLFFIVTSMVTLLVDVCCAADDQTETAKPKNKKNRLRAAQLQISNFSKNITMLHVVVIALIFRFCHGYLRCREEQAWCKEYSEIQFDVTHFGILMLVIHSYMYVTYEILDYTGNAFGAVINTIFRLLIPKTCAILVTLYWAWETFVNLKYKHRVGFVAEFPSIALVSLLLSFFALSYDCLCIYYKENHRQPRRPSKSGTPAKYRFLMWILSKLTHKTVVESEDENEMEDDKEEVEKLPPSILGIGSVYSALFINQTIIFCLILSILLGSSYAVPAIMMTVTLWYLALLFAFFRHRNCREIQEFCKMPWMYVVVWNMSSIYWFYATGHNASFSGVDWNAAFLFQKNIGNQLVIPAILVLVNTFASYIIHGFLLVILVITPFTLNSLRTMFFPVVNPTVDSNELVMARENEIFTHATFVVIMKYYILCFVRIFVMMVSAVIHRRHLMMWEIFAPKLIYEVGALICGTLPFAVMAFIFVNRVTIQEFVSVLRRTLFRPLRDHRNALDCGQAWINTVMNGGNSDVARDQFVFGECAEDSSVESDQHILNHCLEMLTSAITRRLLRH